ncbi:MAG: C/D box methylation guide ribonucleoprotein complex aNOP56 subunit, partial [Candidatus Woesearchaeota archaeon]|nr:C/D box methylation guide ribonucleoprotein complex aNOP56 subunit [Candidatus Woesearchaeota archaeon]
KKLNLKESIGSSLKKADLSPIISIALQISNLYKLLKTQETYLEQCMNRYCPNITAITGSLIGAKLLNQAGSLKHLSEFPSSTIQLLGAEKALFRHLKTGANSPRYGFLHEHPLLAKSKKKIQGKVARALADKIAIAAKVDYFKGKPIGEKLRKSLEAKFK